jgi:hypothetical protein
MMRSASVDLPWSMWAIIEKLRIFFMFCYRLITSKKGALRAFPNLLAFYSKRLFIRDLF